MVGWNKTKSKILQRLADITPTIEINLDNDESEGSKDSPEQRAYNVAVIVNKALDGDMDPINSTTDVITRGKAKAMLIKIKRGLIERPEVPSEAPSGVTKSAPASTPIKKSDEVGSMSK